MMIVGKIIGFIRRIYFNYRYLPSNIAKFLPIDVAPDVKIGSLKKGSIVISPQDGTIYKSMIQIGCSKAPHLHPQQGWLSVAGDGQLIFTGRAWFNEGCSIQVDNGGRMQFGDKFHANANCFFRAAKKVAFGDEVLIGWDVNVNDCDGHHVFIDGTEAQMSGEVKVGNHVWIAAHVNILKNTMVGDGCIVAQRALVNKPFPSSNILIGGVPAKRLRDNVSWEY